MIKRRFNMLIPDTLFERLDASKFRKGFSLANRKKELSYLREKGIGEIMEHAKTFINERISPADIENDGRQTPMKNHPVFIAQHATGICCRKCIEKWHGIKRGHELTDEEKDYLLQVLRIWLSRFV